MRPLPRTLAGWIGLGLVLSIAAYLIYPIISHDPERGMRYSKELSNLRGICIAVHAYAADHEGLLPGHVADLHEAGLEYLPALGFEMFFTSAFHTTQELKWGFDGPAPSEWYMYGSYHFAPISGLHHDDITHAPDFVLAYGPAQGDPPRQAVVFFDGSARWLTEQELVDLLAKQDDMIVRE